jgi:hypothetical protein
MALGDRDNWMLQQPHVRPDYIAPEMQHLFPGYRDGCKRRDFEPDEKTAEERVTITPLQEKYGLEAVEGKPLPKRPKRKTGYLDPRSER